MQEWNGKRIILKNKIFKIQSVMKLGDKYSILGFWEVDGSIPKNSHVAHIEIKSLDDIVLKE